MAASPPGSWEPLPLGAVRPQGWIRSELAENLAGFTGHLDEIVPDLVVADAIYGRDRLGPGVTHKNVGAQGVPVEFQSQFLWWNSETQSNWWDGFVRTAVLLGDGPALRRARAQVDAILATQDPDGYIGIYSPSLRYSFHDENGELWSKATCYRYLVGWYEHTGDPAVLRSLRRAVDNVMAAYPAGASRPFRTDNPYAGGLSHGLAFTDVLEDMHRITGERRYADYAVFLYRNFSAEKLADDAQLARLLDPAQPLTGHGVHTYEHLRSVAAAARFSGDPELARALAAFQGKIDRCTHPSGGPVGDEFIGGGAADPTRRGYEYCSLHELMHGYAALLLSTGQADYGDRAERIFFNAAQGARHPGGRAIAYLKSDNSYAMTGSLNDDPRSAEHIRYKYSPAHQDAAVCCVPNAGRIGPYFVERMWARREDTLVAALLGPCEVATQVAGARVHLVEDTQYPFSGTVRFKAEGLTGPLSLWVRRPGWAAHPTASLPFEARDGYLAFRLAPGADELRVDFHPEVQRHVDALGATYFTLGALVLSHPIAARETISKTYPVPGFADLKETPEHLETYRAGADPLVRGDTAEGACQAQLVGPDGRSQWVPLVPMAGTLLRQVTFPRIESRD